MADIKQDLLGLEYSTSFELQGIQEADINLELLPASAGAATVYGTVTDGKEPLANATVKLFLSTGVPFQHTMTDEQGRYSMNGIPAGTYTVGAVKEGFRLSSAMGVALTAGNTTQVDLSCTADATLGLGAIAGVLTTTVSGDVTPLAGAKLTLRNAAAETVASTYSADDGEFLFYDVADGLYTLLATAEGYLPSLPMAVTIIGGSIANVTMSLVADARTYNGTVSGVIRDQKGAAVAGCFVGLYQVTGTGAAAVERLVSVTKTNEEGKYLFGGVAGGQYLVKAKMSR